jgi:hypothetical protein
MGANFTSHRKAAPAMMYAASKASRPWRVIADEVKLENDPAPLLKLVEELNRAMAEQGLESQTFVSHLSAGLSNTA